MRSNLPGALRALRYRRGWRQADLGRRSGLSRDVVSRVERGVLHGITLGSLSRLADALDASLVVEVRWHCAELDRLIDRTHAALGNAAAERLARAGWITRAEVSFNHYGDRGRCDLVAWHPRTRTLLMVEVKSRIGDLQDTLGRLDTKARLGSVIAGQLGLGEPARVVPAFVLGEGGANRRVVLRHEALFRPYGVRGRAAQAWLRAPVGATTGLLWFESSDSDKVHTTRDDATRRHRPAG